MAEEDLVWVEDILYDTVVNDSRLIAEDRMEDVEKQARKVFSDFYKVLASRGRFVDVEAPAPELRVDWEPLSKKWASYKKFVMAGRPKGKGARKLLGAAGNPNRYFFGISAHDKTRPSLISFYARRNAFKDFGNPEVSLVTNKALKRGVQINKAGRAYYQRRKYGRGFASASEAFEISFSIEVQGFSQIDGLSEYEIMSRFGDGKMAGIMRTLEFGGEGLKSSRIPARPLFIPYLKWFMKRGFDDLMREV